MEMSESVARKTGPPEAENDDAKEDEEVNEEDEREERVVVVAEVVVVDVVEKYESVCAALVGCMFDCLFKLC